MARLLCFVLAGLSALVVAMPLVSPGVRAGATTEDPFALLAARRWTLSAINDQPVTDRAGITATFSLGGSVYGSGGCNSYSGTWLDLPGDAISISGIAATRSRCRAGRQQLERRYLQQLILATTFTVEARALALATEDGRTLRFRAGARTGSAMIGTWKLTSLDTRPVPDIPRATATFSEDGTISGTGGCNTYRAPFRIDDAALRVGPVAAMLGTCAAHVMRHEHAFLAAFETVTGWKVRSDRLTLRARGGRSLVFTAVRPVSFSLTDVPWTLVKFGATRVEAAAGMNVRFGLDGTVSGSGGCNTFSGRYTQPDLVLLQIGPLVASQATCAPTVMQNEAAYLDALESALGYKTPEGKTLQINTATGLRLEFAPIAPPEMVATNWRLVEAAGQAVGQLSTIMIHFADDASITGFGGCDLYSGSYELTGDAIRISDVTVGANECDASALALQRAYLALLPLMDRTTQEGRMLVMAHRATGNELRFEAR
jgi:heat shock protein HslJ